VPTTTLSLREELGLAFKGVGLGDVPTTTLSLREELGLALNGKSEIEPRRRGAVPGTPPPARSAARQIAS
jgi:hypothetical protein